MARKPMATLSVPDRPLDGSRQRSTKQELPRLLEAPATPASRDQPKQLPPTPRILPRLLALKRIAAHLDVSERSVRRLVDSGEISHVRVGGQIRVSDDDLLDYIRRNRR